MKKIFAVLFLLILIFYTSCTPIEASILPEIETNPMTAAERQNNSYLCELKNISKPKNNHSNILQLAVNQDETEIALSMRNYTILIYDIKGNYKYGFKSNAGQWLGLDYNLDNDLCIYLVRSKILFKIDGAGQVQNMEWVKTTEQNEEYCQLLTIRTEITKGNNTYFLDGRMGVKNKCILHSLNGEFVLLDYGDQVILFYIIFPILIFVAGFLTVITIILTVKHKRARYKDNGITI